MVAIDPRVGHDITPPGTGFYTISAYGQPFSLRSFPCGTDMFNTLMSGTYANIPYYVGTGDCVQLYNPNNMTIDIGYTVRTDSPATTFFSVSVSLWVLLLIFSYVTMLFVMFGGTRYMKNNWGYFKKIWKRTQVEDVKVSTNMPSLPEYIQPPNAPLYHQV